MQVAEKEAEEKGREREKITLLMVGLPTYSRLLIHSIPNSRMDNIAIN